MNQSPFFRFLCCKLLTVSVLLLNGACNSSVEQEEILPDYERQYFDLSGFIAQQRERLTQADLQLVKTVQIDDKTETRVLSDLTAWDEELAMFGEADLNRPALKGAYDSLKTMEDEIEATVYTAKDKRTRVQQLTVERNQGKVVGLRVKQYEDNFFYQTEQNMRMHIENGLMQAIEINGYQKLIGRDKSNYSVDIVVKAEGKSAAMR